MTPVHSPSRLIQTLQEQVRLFRRAAESLVKQSHTKDTTSAETADKDRDSYESDVAELQEQIVKLKGELLSLLLQGNLSLSRFLTQLCFQRNVSKLLPCAQL